MGGWRAKYFHVVFYQLEISAESVEEAKAITDQNYVTATSFTVQEDRGAVTDVVEATSKEEVPMICLIPFEANSVLGEWTRKTIELAK